MENNDWVYSDEVKEHFLNPKNWLRDNENDWGADGKGIAGNPVCGDMMLVLIKVSKNKISDIAWKTYGCASAIASTSMLSETAKGLTLERASNITPKMIADKLGGLPENKFHCSVLGDEALKNAINDYRKKTKNP